MLDPETLWGLSTGGARVAADPDPATPPPEIVGQAPAGVGEAAAQMSRALSEAGAQPHFLFLVGGPGGGKSRVAAAVVAPLPAVETIPEDGLVQRSYLYEAAGRRLLLVNDATIEERASGSEVAGLTSDVHVALEGNFHLLACVNRGVLVDEATTLAEGGTAEQILRYVSDSSVGDPSSYIRQSIFSDGATEVLVTAVYVDVCSLLERRPATHEHAQGLTPAPYELLHFEGADRSQTPAGSLLSQVVAAFSWEGELDKSIDPVKANLDSLGDREVANGLLALMRGGEIVSGQRFSYRELWGCVARCLAGELPQAVRASDAYSALSRTAGEGDPPSWDAMKGLAEHRWFVSLFGGLDPAPHVAAQDPVLRITAVADPLLDASPSWAVHVADAFSNSVLESSPLAEVRAAMPEKLHAAIQPFDEALDAAFVTYCEQAKTFRERAAAESWYGRYLTRLFACAFGIPAFADAVAEWVSTYTYAPSVSDRLRPLLSTLLSPRRFANRPDADPLVPLYASKTDPLLGHVEQPTLALRAQPFHFSTRSEGEDLKLMVREEGEPVGEVLLDFALVREALACAHDWLGMTEASEHTSPRVERFRSRRLTSGALSRHLQLAVAVGDEDHLVTVQQRHS